MYTAFHGLREKPFALSPDPRFLFLAQSHREALAHLLYGIEQGEGFIVITGEVGTGKTTLCRTLLQRLGAENEVAFVFNPKLSGLELLKAINAEFGLSQASDSQHELADALNRFLVEKKRDARRVLLIIDEAQNLERETLEQVRLLSNLETETSKLIQIVLLGQPELDDMLESPDLRQLKQRIGVRWRLRPLSPSETREYVRHRLRVAAGAAREPFTPAALRELHRLSGGIPRIVNVLADRSLLAGYAAGSRELGTSLVRQAAAEVRGGGGARRRAHRPAWIDVSLATALLAGAGLWLWLSRTPEATPVPMDPPVDVASPPPAAVAEPTAAPVTEQAPAPTRVASVEPTTLPPLGELLASESEEKTSVRALDALLATWGLAAESRPPRSLGDVLDALGRRQLAVLEVPRGDLASLRALNHPALLRIDAADGTSRLVVLRSLDPWHATLLGVGPSGAVRVSAAELEALWDGDAWVPWRDFEGLPATLPDRGRALVWLQESLGSLGFYAGPPTGRYDDATRDAVRAFQRSRDLAEDGAVGPRTKMALYDSLGRYEVPRLQAEGDVG